MFEPLELPGLVLVQPARHKDARGHFSQTYVAPSYRENGIDADFVQDNQSYSRGRGVVRGLHFQSPPYAQAKLVRCSLGAILDVAVDIRRGSPTYGKHVSVELSTENGAQLYIPAGFAHGFCTLSEETLVDYKVSALYAPTSEGGIIWNDARLNIDWHINNGAAHLSDKDKALPAFNLLDTPFKWTGEAQDS